MEKGATAGDEANECVGAARFASPVAANTPPSELNAMGREHRTAERARTASGRVDAPDKTLVASIGLGENESNGQDGLEVLPQLSRYVEEYLYICSHLERRCWQHI